MRRACDEPPLRTERAVQAREAVYSATSGHPLVVPLAALAGGIGVGLAVGAVAGVYPAIRAARLAPTEALRAT